MGRWSPATSRARLGAAARDLGRSPLPAAAAAALAPVVARIPQLGVPLMIDLPIYAVIGARMGHGAIPYQDLFDNKQPLIFGVFWLIDLIAPQSTIAIRVAAALVAAVTSVAMFFLLRSLIGAKRALLAGILTGILGASFVVEGLELNTEHLLCLTGTVAVLFPLAYGRSSSISVALIAGLLGGLALLTKAVAAFMLPAALLPLVWHARRDSSLSKSVVLAYGGGVLLPLAATAALFAPFGALDDLWYGNVAYNFLYIDLVEPQPLTSMIRFPGELQVLVVAAVCIGVWRLVSLGVKDLFSWTCLLWIIGSLLAAKQGRREFAHYYAQVIPAAVTLLCAPPRGSSRSLFLRTDKPSGRPALVISAAIILAGALPLFADVGRTFTRSPIENGRVLWGSPVDFTDRQAQVGFWIAGRAGPRDELFVEGSWPAVYWGAGLAPATRYLYDFYVPALEPDFFERTSAELLGDPPEWIVLFDDLVFPDYISQLEPRFEVARAFDGIIVMRLKDAAVSE